MIRLANSAFAFTIAIAVLAGIVDGPAGAEASPMPAPPARSIDISTSQTGCATAPDPGHPQSGLTLGASAVADQRTVAALAASASILDALPPAAVPTQVRWSHGCASWNALTA